MVLAICCAFLLRHAAVLLQHGLTCRVVAALPEQREPSGENRAIDLKVAGCRCLLLGAALPRRLLVWEAWTRPIAALREAAAVARLFCSVGHCDRHSVIKTAERLTNGVVMKTPKCKGQAITTVRSILSLIADVPVGNTSANVLRYVAVADTMREQTIALKCTDIACQAACQAASRRSLANGPSGAASPASNVDAARAAGVDRGLDPEAVRCTELCAARATAFATVSALRSACSRTDFFIFDGYLPSESKENIQAESTELQCLTTPELHLLVFWSAMPDNQFSGLHRVVAALSDVVSYPGADYHVRLHGVFRADPGAEKIDESWYQAFYGDTYYGLYFGTSDKVDMLHVKGDGAFHVALVEDMCPKYAYDLERGMVLNTNMFALKNMLRELSPQWYQVHATQTLQESNTNYKFLFGGTAREIFRSLQLDKRWSAAEYSEARVDNGAYVLAWRRVFISVDAMETLGAMMQSEWYRLELDVPEIHVCSVSIALNHRGPYEISLSAAGRVDSGYAGPGSDLKPREYSSRCFSRLESTTALGAFTDRHAVEQGDAGIEARQGVPRAEG
ncbi:hypothetical protein ON010_g16653 [Phytophthora cinnamomi]|nr:hypothetical protein ON010_g16653 [Phytophthora cinnamomi]